MVLQAVTHPIRRCRMAWKVCGTAFDSRQTKRDVNMTQLHSLQVRLGEVHKYSRRRQGSERPVRLHGPHGQVEDYRCCDIGSDDIHSKMERHHQHVPTTCKHTYDSVRGPHFADIKLQYYHRNMAAEVMGIIDGPYGGSSRDLRAGGLSVQPSYTPHGGKNSSAAFLPFPRVDANDEQRPTRLTQRPPLPS